MLEEALGLWRGPAIDDLAEQRALQPHITRLEEQRLAATEERIGAEIDLGRYAEVVGSSRRWCCSSPCVSAPGPSS